MKKYLKVFFKFIVYSFFYILNLPNIYIKRVKLGARIEIFGLLCLRNKGLLSIGSNVRINSSKFPNPIGGGYKTNLQVLHGASLFIGSFTKITNVSITCAKEIYIGENVFIGDGVGIFDTDFHPLAVEARIKNLNHLAKCKPIIISDNVFIGTRAVILKGVSIGAGSVVGASSVVSCNIPENQIWAGNPAKFIRNISK